MGTIIKPEFIIIGAMKSGTTTLHDYLDRHPKISMSNPKEPGYFSRDDRFAKGSGWYSSFFTGASSGQICGESSTCYTRCTTYPGVPKRIYDYVPNVKLIYIVRHPVERCYSHYVHSFLHRELSERIFNEALLTHDEILTSSMYMMQINRFLEWFDKDRILIVDFSRLTTIPDKELKRISRFLGVEEMDLRHGSDLVSNSAGEVRVNNAIRKMIRSIRSSFLISIIIDNFIPKNTREKVLEKITSITAKSAIGNQMKARTMRNIGKLTENDRKYILLKCKSDTKAFENYSGLDLSNWYS